SASRGTSLLSSRDSPHTAINAVMVASRKSPSLNIPLQKTGEIIEHVGAERKCKAVDIRFAFTGRQNRHDRNCSFENYRGNEHRDRTLAVPQKRNAGASRVVAPERPDTVRVLRELR